MSYDILRNETWYKQISLVEISAFQSEFMDLISLVKSLGLIDQSTWDFLNNRHPVAAIFYAIPKVHKNINRPPGRPIISGINNLTNNAYIMVEEFLKSFVEQLPLFLKDTMHLLNILDNLKDTRGKGKRVF